MNEKERLEKIEREIEIFQNWWYKYGKVTPISVNLEECRKGATRRHKSFNGKNSKRLFNDRVKEELIGYCGEVAAEKLLGYPMNNELGPDNGVDFILPSPIDNVNVKCTERWLNLLIKKKDPLLQNTNIVIASYFIQETKMKGTVYFVGVTLTRNIGNRRWEEEYFNSTYTNNWRRPLWDLTPMDRFLDVLKKAESRFTEDQLKEKYGKIIL